MTLITIISLGFLVAFTAPVLNRISSLAAGDLLAIFPLGLFVYLLFLAPGILSGDPLHEFISWIPSLDIHLAFYLDGLGLLFALLVTGIGTAVFIYAAAYLHNHPNLGRFYFFLLVFMTSMLGIVVSDNILMLFVFWELTSLSSYFLISFEHEKETARSAALQSLLVTGAGGLALLAGFLLLGHVGGSMSLSGLMQNKELIAGHMLYVPIIGCIFIGAFTKSAQFPFHFWLPNAMEAPTPVSAYLHSATMVKAGIFLIARMSPLLGGTPYWSLTLITVGTLTMLAGAYLAFFQSHFKRYLAYSTISALGMLVLLLGIGSPLAIIGAMVFLLAHALYKGAMFMVAGIVHHQTHETDVHRLGGLFRSMPYTATAAILAALSMAGLPPFIGFIGKELLYDASWSAAGIRIPVVAAAVLANMLYIAVAFIIGIKPFTGPEKQRAGTISEAPWRMVAGPLIMAFLGLLAGLFPKNLAQPIITASVNAIVDHGTPFYLSLWHGVNAALILDGIAIAGGISVFFGHNIILGQLSKLPRITEWGPQQGYHFTLESVLSFAAWQTKILQNGRLRYYLAVTILSVVSLLTFTILTKKLPLPADISLDAIGFLEAGLLLLILFSTIVVIFTRSRLSAVASLGVIGFCMALIFIVFGAPDLAMTQFVIETLMVILLVFVLHHLPPYQTFTSRTDRIRDAFVAAAGGTVMSLLVLLAIKVQFHEPVSSFFVENSYLLAHGRNIVNTILVDFRGFDTLGEITVLAIAALGVHALLKLPPVKDLKK